MKNKGIYTNFDGEKVEFEYINRLTLGNKIDFVMSYADFIVSDNYGYAPMLSKIVFYYMMILYFTDIRLFNNDFDFDALEMFCNVNRDSVITTIIDGMEDGLYLELKTHCSDVVNFRKEHFSAYNNEVSKLLQTVKELVAKPDYMNELLATLTNYLNKISEKEIDTEAIGKLADIVPVIKDMGSVEVAKAIINEKGNH